MTRKPKETTRLQLYLPPFINIKKKHSSEIAFSLQRIRASIAYFERHQYMKTFHRLVIPFNVIEFAQKPKQNWNLYEYNAKQNQALLRAYWLRCIFSKEDAANAAD